MRTLKKFWIVMVAALGVFASAAAIGDASYREQMKGLDEQVQEIKSDVLSIAAELARLEERLLYPSNTHVAVFVALAERDTLRLDAVQIQIDGQPVAHYIYSFKELEALQKGGVQRIYTGNVPTGEHQLEVTIAGKLDSGKDYTRTERFSFNKGVEPKLLGITLGAAAAAARGLVTSMPRTSLIVGLGLASALAAAPCASKDLRDLYFGEALYYAHQGHYFEALERLDAEIAQHHGLDEPQLDSLHYPHRRGRVLRRRLRAQLPHAPSRRPRHQGRARRRRRRSRAQRSGVSPRAHSLPEGPARPMRCIALDRIQWPRARSDPRRGRVPARQRLHGARPSRGCGGRAQALAGCAALTGFAAYNLGIALLQEGREPMQSQQLDRAGQLSVADAGPLAIRDKSNLMLGELLLESTDFARAQQFFDRVRLDGPFSNQALLRSGWADVSAQKYDRALVPWSMLAKREVTDGAVQEAMLALPYAYSKLNVHGRAAVMYGHALEVVRRRAGQGRRFDQEHRATGRFLKALVREEIQQDKDWVIRLRTLPDAPETYYLMQLMASHDFQTALQNYLDLEELRKKLSGWQSSFDCVRGHDPPAPAELRAAAARHRCAVPRAGCADSPAHGAAQSSAAATAAAADRAAAGSAGDGGRAHRAGEHPRHRGRAAERERSRRARSFSSEFGA